TFRFSTTATVNPFLSVVSLTAGNETSGAGPGFGSPVWPIAAAAPRARNIAGRNDFDSSFMILFIASGLRFLFLVVIEHDPVVVRKVMFHHSLNICRRHSLKLLHLAIHGPGIALMRNRPLDRDRLAVISLPRTDRPRDQLILRLFKLFGRNPAVLDLFQLSKKSLLQRLRGALLRTDRKQRHPSAFGIQLKVHARLLRDLQIAYKCLIKPGTLTTGKYRRRQPYRGNIGAGRLRGPIDQSRRGKRHPRAKFVIASLFRPFRFLHGYTRDLALRTLDRTKIFIDPRIKLLLVEI